MTLLNLKYYIQHPESLNRDTLYEFRVQLARYPYCQTLRLLLLKNLFLLKDSSFSKELREAALYVSDRSLMFQLLERSKYHAQANSEVADSEATNETDEFDRTLTLIDAFLSTLPEEKEEETQLEYVTDYTSFLLEQDDIDSTMSDSCSDSKFNLIDNFIEKSTQDTPLVQLSSAPVLGLQDDAESALNLSANVIEEDDDEYFTETLAKIYIKQHRYSKALEIIKKLSLKYPKKNAYFADQIKTLEELIINTKSK